MTMTLPSLGPAGLFGRLRRGAASGLLLTLGWLMLASPAQADGMVDSQSRQYAWLWTLFPWGWGPNQRVSCVDAAEACGSGYRVAAIGDLVVAEGESGPGWNRGSVSIGFPGDYLRDGLANSWTWWVDSITVQSSSLPLGSFVALTLRLDLAFSTGDGGGNITAAWHFSGPDCCDLLRVEGGTGAGQASGSVTYMARVGDTLQFAGTLGQDISLQAPAGAQAGRFSAASALYAIDRPDTVSLLAASGYSYITEVPEPTTAWLMGLGVAGLMLRRRRQPAAAAGLSLGACAARATA